MSFQIYIWLELQEIYKKKQELLGRGFSEVILENDGILHTNQTFTKILDLVGPSVMKDSISHLAEDGIICSCGQLGGQWTLKDFDTIMELYNNVYLTTFYSGNVTTNKLQDLIDFVEKYNVNVRPEKIFKIEQIQEAH